MYKNRKYGLKTVSNLAAQKSIENSQQDSLNVSRVLAEINGPPNPKIARLEVSFLTLCLTEPRCFQRFLF